MITLLDLHAAVVKVWDDFNLDAEFKQYWAATKKDEFTVLNDTEADAGTPMPYCVYESGAGSVEVKTSGSESDTRRREIHNFPWEFRVHASQSGGKSAKAIAGELAEDIIKHYGGHPDVDPKNLTLTSSGVVLVQYENDFGVRTGEDEFQWNVNYTITLDMPMKR